MKRVLPLLVAVCILVGALAAPVMAARVIMNYEDYITNVEVDGDNDLVTLSLPVGGTEWQVFRGGGLWLREFGVDRISWTDSGSYIYDVYAYPLGNGYELSLSNIPDDSVLYMSFVSDYIGGGHNTPQIAVQCYYNDASGNIISYVQYNHGSTAITGEYGITVDIDKPVGAVTCWLRVSFTGYKPLTVGQTMGIRMKSYELMLSISSLYRMQQEIGKTNMILGEVEKQLEQNGQKLDDIINGESGIDSGVTDFDSVGDDMQSAGNQANSAIGDGLGTLGDLAGSGAVTSTLAVLGGAIASVFVGNEVTLCGMTFNPFEVLVVVLGAVSLLGLFLAYIFRKRGGS